MPNGIALTGFDRHSRQLLDLQRTIGRERERWVVSAAWYAHFKELGTSKERAEPYFEPGLRQAARDPGARLSDAFWGGRVLSHLTDQSVTKIRAQIIARGLVDRGLLLRSIADGKTLREATRNSRAKIAGTRADAG